MRNEPNYGVDVYRNTKVAYIEHVRYVTQTCSVVLLNTKTHTLLSEVHCVWQVVKTASIILNNPVLSRAKIWFNMGREDTSGTCVFLHKSNSCHE